MVKTADHIASRSTSVINKKTADKTPFFQAKLTVNEPGDQYEQEADAVAERVMRMPEGGSDAPFFKMNPVPVSAIQKKCAHCEEEEKLQKKDDEERSEDLIQAKKAPEFSLQRKCDACEHEENIQRKGSAINSAPTVSNSVHQTLGSTGQPMDAGTRGFMESRFGYNFGSVRIHNDMMAHRSSKALHARAYTHGQHIVFGSGQYQPKTKSGKQLLAHELAHVLQQGGGGNNYIQRDPLPDHTPVHKYYYPDSINVDVKGKSQFLPGEDIARYIDDYSQQNQKAVVNIQYGGLGQGNIFVTSTRNRVATTTNCDYSLIGVIPVGEFPLPIIDVDCHDDFDPAKTQFDYNAPWQIFPIKLPGLDTSKYNGTLVMGIAIESGNIKGKLGWVQLIPEVLVFRGVSYDVRYGHKDFLPLIYGKDYTGQDFTDKHFENELKNGVFSFTSWAEFILPSFQKMSGTLSRGDKGNGWSGSITTDIIGAENFELEVDRSDGGDINGEGDGITLNEEWKGKGFTAAAKLHASYVNSHLSVTGEASYNSKRASGKLFLAVTDYETARKYAADYLPEEIAALARADKPTPDKAGHLAFVGAGKLGFILFDGKKNTETGGRKKGDSIIGRDDPKDQEDIAPVTVDTSFVVEPEGYITVAGQIKQPTGEYELFKRMDYSKKIHIATIPVAYIPLPAPGAYCDFNISLDLKFGAHIGPLTLSQLSISGIYSNRPGAFKELELSGFVELSGGIFAELILALNASVGFGPFSIDVLSKEITFGAEFGGTVSARPTIRIRKTDTDSNTPREYYIKGNFDFDAAGQLAYQINDSFKANAEKEESDKDKTPQTYKYLNSTEKADKNVSGKDIEVPIDNSLGSEEPPDFVSVDKFKNINLGTVLNKIIKGRKTKKYFEEGVSDSQGNKEFKSPSKEFGAGDYMEGGQKRGHLGKTTTPQSDFKNKVTYQFDEAFHMKDKLHHLHLLVDLVEENGKITSIREVLTMSSDGEEELSEKIKEEKTEVDRIPDATDALQDKALQAITDKEKEIKEEVRDLAMNGQLTEDTKPVELLEAKVELEDYAKSFNRDNLGNDKAPDKILKPNCDAPADLYPGQDVVFEKFYKDGRKTGRVIEVVSRPSTDGSIAHWYITFKPTTGRSTTSLSPRAFADDYCKIPNYTVPKKKGECNTEFLPRPIVKQVPARSINGETFYGYEKASEITAVPLCWGSYQAPEKPVVGIDRIRQSQNWHRAHLLHGELGGKGIRANLVPTPKYINENVMPDEYEDDLYNKVVQGQSSGKQYWFKAEVIYHGHSDNYDIKNYDDFVKEIKIYYGEATLVDQEKKQWDMADKNIVRATVTLDLEPSLGDMKPSRTSG